MEAFETFLPIFCFLSVSKQICDLKTELRFTKKPYAFIMKMNLKPSHSLNMKHLSSKTKLSGSFYIFSGVLPRRMVFSIAKWPNDYCYISVYGFDQIPNPGE